MSSGDCWTWTVGMASVSCALRPDWILGPLINNATKINRQASASGAATQPIIQRRRLERGAGAGGGVVRISTSPVGRLGGGVSMARLGVPSGCTRAVANGSEAAGWGVEIGRGVETGACRAGATRLPAEAWALRRAVVNSATLPHRPARLSCMALATAWLTSSGTAGFSWCRGVGGGRLPDITSTAGAGACPLNRW